MKTTMTAFHSRVLVSVLSSRAETRHWHGARAQPVFSWSFFLCCPQHRHADVMQVRVLPQAEWRLSNTVVMGAQGPGEETSSCCLAFMLRRGWKEERIAFFEGLSEHRRVHKQCVWRYHWAFLCVCVTNSCLFLCIWIPIVLGDCPRIMALSLALFMSSGWDWIMFSQSESLGLFSVHWERLCLLVVVEWKTSNFGFCCRDL